MGPTFAINRLQVERLLSTYVLGECGGETGEVDFVQSNNCLYFVGKSEKQN